MTDFPYQNNPVGTGTLNTPETPPTSKPMTATQINAIQEEALGLMRELNEYAQKHYRSQPRCTCDLMSICTRLYSALIKRLGSSSDETTACPPAPIVRVVIENGKAAYTTIYAPGLPDGTHDLYCVPEAVAPMMRAEAQTSGECPVCLGERRVTIGRRAIGQDSRVKALQMMYVEQPCPMCNAQKATDDWRCPQCGSRELLTSPWGSCRCGWSGLIGLPQNGEGEV